MRWKIFCLIILGMFFISGASALTTVVEVKTLPHHMVHITPLDSSDGSTLTSPKQGFSNKYGDVTFNLDFEDSTFDLLFLIKDETDNHIILAKKLFDKFSSGGIVKVEVLPEGVEPILKPEEEKVEEIEVVEEENETEANSTGIIEEPEIGIDDTKLEKIIMNGYSVVEENKPIVNTIYYSVLSFTALLLIFLTVRKNGKKVDKISKKKGKIDAIDEDDELNEAEENLKKAQARVEELKKKKGQKIEEAKKKLLEAEKELMELRGVKIEKSKEMTTEEMKKKVEEASSDEKN